MPLNFIAKAAITVALTAANAALTMTRRIEGPRLDDRSFTDGDYGASIARIWGRPRMAPPIFWAEDLKEVKRRRKTKGGKYNEYTYYGTWAVAIACHEIQGIARIYFDKKLVFDLTGAGPVTPFDFGDRRITKDPDGPWGIGIGGTNYGDVVAFYPGSPDQNPDPRIQAWVEAKFGEGSCPAYRDVAYLVFKDVPLEKFGNRIPQTEVEPVSLADDYFPYEKKAVLTTQPHRLFGFTFSPDYSRLMWGNLDYYEIWDAAARSPMIGGTLPYEINDQAKLGLFNSGAFMAVTSDNGTLLSFTADGLSAVEIFDFPSGMAQQEVRVLQDADGQEHWATIPWSTQTAFFFDSTTPRFMSALTGVDWQPTDWFNDSEGNIWAVGHLPGASYDTAYFYKMTGGYAAFSISGLSGGNPVCATSAGDGYILMVWGGDLFRIEIASGSVVASRTDLSLDFWNTPSQFANKPPQATSIWLDNYEISVVDLTTIRIVSRTNWTSDDWDGIIYDPVNHALISIPQYQAAIAWNYLDRVTSNGVLLRDIVEDVCANAGIDADDINATALTQIIPSYSATQGTGKDWLEPLLDLYDVDPRPHGFELEFLPRGGAAGAALFNDAFALPNGGGSKGDGGNTYSFARSGGSDVPVMVRMNFADVNADLQVNEADSPPLSSIDGKGVATLNMSTLGLDVDTARQLVSRYHRRKVLDRLPYAFALSAREAALEPGDVHPVELREVTEGMRCVSMELGADGRIATEWKRDDPSAAVLDGATGALFDGRNPTLVSVPLISKGFVLDIPLLADDDNNANPLVYVGAGPYSAGTWPGALLFEDVDGEYSDEFASVDVSRSATWGYSTDVLGSPVSSWLWDRGNSVNIRIQFGTLTGCTEADIDADPTLNQCYLGGELINFTTATLEADGTYTLSGFKRGRRGTEWACDGHAPADIFWLLDTSEPIVAGTSDVGTDMSFKAVTNGRTASGAFPIDLQPFTGASLKPYAPCHVEAIKDSGTGDWTLTWVRRTRVGGAWTSGTSIPLSETSEEYEVDILDAPGGSVVRTYSSLSSATATYSAADQTTDGGDVPEGSLYFAVYQISDAVDRGFAAEATA